MEEFNGPQQIPEKKGAVTVDHLQKFYDRSYGKDSPMQSGSDIMQPFGSVEEDYGNSEVIKECLCMSYQYLNDRYESERTAHDETKRNHASVVERLFYSEREQLKLGKRLEELEKLEDANQKLRELYYTERKDLAQFREYADTYYPDLWDCFENSRERRDREKIRTSVREIIPKRVYSEPKGASQ